MTTCSSIIKAKHSKQEIERPQETIRPISILGFEGEITKISSR